MSREPDVIEVSARKVDGQVVYEYDRPATQAGGNDLWRKVKVWVTIAAGVGVGVLLFLSFLTIFLYVVLPLTILVLLWRGVQRLLQPR